MPMVTMFNLEAGDRLPELEEATRRALTSMPELEINDAEVDLVPTFAPNGFGGAVVRINVELWEHPERTKGALQELATRVADAFQEVAGPNRGVKVLIRPHNIEGSGWVSR